MATSAIPIRCAGCSKSINYQNESLFTLRKTWHKQCFKCSVCKIQLQDLFFTRKKKLYCRQHYLTKYAHTCHRCNKKVTGLAMVAGDVGFHPECFRCIKCRHLIGHGDNYVFEERSLLYCHACYQSDVNDYMKFKKFKSFQRNAIHQLNVFPSQMKQKKLSFAFKEIRSEAPHQIESGSKQTRRGSIVSIISTDDDPSSLSTGDTILEINGIPVSNKNIKQFSKLFENDTTNNCISVTIERNIKQDDSHQHISSPQHSDPIDPDVYERNVSFFNFSVFHRTESDPAVMKRKAQNRKKKLPVKGFSLDGIPEEDRKKLMRPIRKNHMHCPQTQLKLVRSKSLNDVDSLSMEYDRQCFKNEIKKAISPLHRAQSLKPSGLKTVNHVFRPMDLTFGEVIGSGFFGDVIKITHKVSGEEMVMKKLHQVDPEAEEQFLKEVQVLKTLYHPNVLRCIGIMYKESTLHLVTEYIAGGTLTKLLKHKYIELSWKQKMELAKDIASGMAYLHDQNVMHRDMKSKNVLIKSKEGGARIAIVADFGLATVMHECHNNCLTPLTPRFDKLMFPPTNNVHSPVSPVSPRKRHTVVGTPCYMAPEMLKGDEYDASVDVFSYGIVMCEILGRVKAYTEQLPRKHDFGLDYEKFKELVGESCPIHLLDLAAECCNMQPEKRPNFHCCEQWLQSMLANITFNIPLPANIDFRIEPKPIRLKSVSNK